MTLADISPAISIAAILISLFTLWFTILRRGTIKSTHPSFIAVRYDFVDKNVPQAKIFFRSLLFNTAKRGQVIESLFLRVCKDNQQTEFSFWGHGDKDLTRGSGLFIPESGVVTNHHFNPIDSEALFQFTEGEYSLELIAKVIGNNNLVSLWNVSLKIPSGIFDSSISSDTAIYYSWSPEQKCFISSIETRRK